MYNITLLVALGIVLGIGMMYQFVKSQDKKSKRIRNRTSSKPSLKEHQSLRHEMRQNHGFTFGE